MITSKVRAYLLCLLGTLFALAPSAFGASIRFPVGNPADGSPYTTTQTFQHVPFTYKGKTYSGHLGEDWGVSYEDVFPMAAGTVVLSKDLQDDWGNVIVITHPSLVPGRTIYSLYGHLKTRLVSEGTEISDLAQPIGVSGKKGSGPHLHFEIKDYGNNPVTAGSGYTQQPSQDVDSLVFRGVTYFRPTKFINERLSLVPPSTEIVYQPGNDVGVQDIWTTSVYSYTGAGGGPGGGLNNELLRVGGFGDLYYSLIEFDLSTLPLTASRVELQLYMPQVTGEGTTALYLDRITTFWDWRTRGTGQDRLRLWWADRPSAVQWIATELPAPTAGQWYAIDITTLYNAWQARTYTNYGVQLRPVNNNNTWAEFDSSNSPDPSLRPRLVITPNTTVPAAIITAIPARLASGSSSTITWHASNVDHCTVTSSPGGVILADGSADGQNQFIGSALSGPIIQQTVFTINCTTNSSAVSSRVIVNILPVFGEF